MYLVPTLSLLALFVTIALGIMRPKINIGVTALAFAVIIGIGFSGMKEKELLALFPTSLFITLFGVTLFFGIIEVNGLLAFVAAKSFLLTKGKTSLLPIVFFFFTAVLSAFGPGNIAATALIAPIGMATAYAYGVSPLLMAIMICTGANAGAFSPIAPTGVILAELGKKIGVADMGIYFQIFLAAAFIQSISAFLAYFIFSRLQKSGSSHSQIQGTDKSAAIRFEFKHGISLFAIFLLIASIVFLRLPLGMTAIVLAVILLLSNIADAEKVFSKIPWDAIMLVCGVSVLIGVMEKAGGLDLATSMIATVSSANSVNAILAVTTGLVSAYSSSSGVVMPAFIPLLPGLIEKLGSGDIVKMLISVAVGSHMVDVSPLSTLGALCIAQAKVGKQSLFKNLMLWGIAMAVFGGILSYVFLDLL